MKTVPKLRFKNFVDQWRVRRGSELFINSRAKGNDDLPLYSVTLDRGMVPRDSLDRRMESEMEAGDNLFVARNDISYNMMRMWQGAYGLAPVDCMVSPAYVVLHPRENVSSDFFTKYFARSRNLYLFTAFSYGLTSDRLRLYFKDFAQIKFACPSLPEQQKIASFLSAVDEKIQQLTRKKELLEQHKKGVMQQLFSGKLRFKDENGKLYSKWQGKRLGEIGSTYNGLTGKTKDDFGNGKPYIQYKQIFDNSRISIENCGFVQIGKDENQEQVKFGDIFFTTSSETPEEVGFASVLLENVSEMYLNSFSFGFRPNSLSELVPEFAQFLFRSAVFRKLIVKLAQGSTRYNMSKVELMKLKVSLPSKEEQQKIASFLSSIDSKIKSVLNQMEQTQTFKKGLLQQMFV